MSQRVFVFGTLKQGFPNHHRNRGRRIEGRYRTVEAYPLLLVGERHSPWLVDTPGEGLPVYGEVYELEDAALADMDRLERIDQPDSYRRKALLVVEERSGREQSVQAYLKPVEQYIALPAGEIRSAPLSEYSPALAASYRPRPSQAPSAF